jgi:hypothetical protein
LNAVKTFLRGVGAVFVGEANDQIGFFAARWGDFCVKNIKSLE